MNFKIALLISLISVVAYAQELCPVEDVNVFGGDTQNIVSWSEPYIPFVFTVEITTDDYATETTWSLFDDSGGQVASMPEQVLVDFTTYTWENDISPGNYVFTIYDSWGDGLLEGGSFKLYLDGNVIYEYTGAEGAGWSELDFSFNTDERWFGLQSYSYDGPSPYQRGEAVNLDLFQNTPRNGPFKIEADYFDYSRPVPEDCGSFLTYKVYNSATNTFIGSTSELEFAHTGLTNGTSYSYFIVAVYDVNGIETESAVSLTVSGTPEPWVAAAPTNLVSFPGDEEMLLVWQGAGGGGDFTLGDKIENPFIVDNIPFSDEGSTVGFENDYDAVCPYTGSTAADVVYALTTAGGTYDFTLCTGTTNYDTKLYILDANSEEIGCSDDECSNGTIFTSSYISELSGVNLSSGMYYIIVDGYGDGSFGENEGSYTLDINLSAVQNIDDIPLDNPNRSQYDFLGYNVYVDNVLNNSEPVEFTTYNVKNLQNGIDYTFGVVSVYDGPVGGNNYESEMITVQDASIFIFGDITGIVTDPNGVFLDSAIVSAGGFKDTTGSDGSYSLLNLNVGEQVVTVSRDGFSSEDSSVTVLAQADATVQNFVLSPDMPSPVSLSAKPGDEEVYLSWYKPGSIIQYDIAYYDDFFETQIGCGTAECPFAVRFTPANYPASLDQIVISIDEGGDATSASIEAYLDPSGNSDGPIGDPISISSSINLSNTNLDGALAQFAIDVSDLAIMIESGDIYIVVNEPANMYLSLANDIEPFSIENTDRNWLYNEDYYGLGNWSTIADLLIGSPYYSSLVGDLGILASFSGPPAANASFAVLASSEVESNIDDVSFRGLSNFNVNSNFYHSNNSENLLENLYSPRPIPTLPINHNRDEEPQAYNVYLIADDMTPTLVSTTTDTTDTITVAENYIDYCFNVKATYDTGEPSDGGYGIVESKPSNNACATPFAVGDANFDSETTIDDVLTLVDFILEETIPSSLAFNNSDINMDDELNIADVVMVVDIISGISTARVSSNASFDSLDLKPNYSTSDLLFNISYDGGLKGLEFEIEYDSKNVSLGSPSLVFMQENVVSTFRNIEEGLMKVIVFDIAGDFIHVDEQNNLLKMPFEFFGDVLNKSSVKIKNIVISGPKGITPKVSTSIKSVFLKLIPGVFALHQNYPNPFNPITEIRFDIPEATHIDISIFNLMGQKVKTLKNEKITPGYHIVRWEGTNDNGMQVSTGMYFYTLQTEMQSAMRKMLLLK